MLELRTEFKVDFAVKNGRVVGCLLQRLQEAIKLRPNLGLLGLELLLHLGLNGVNR
jgi:hypothetical protein